LEHHFTWHLRYWEDSMMKNVTSGQLVSFHICSYAAVLHFLATLMTISMKVSREENSLWRVTLGTESLKMLRTLSRLAWPWTSKNVLQLSNALNTLSWPKWSKMLMLTLHLTSLRTWKNFQPMLFLNRPFTVSWQVS
jgi:hypothetical protein